MTPEGYVDDWFCRSCGAGPLTEALDSCPVCNTAWLDSRPVDLRPDDECPNCRCGTLEPTEDHRLVCRGECGAFFPQSMEKSA